MVGDLQLKLFHSSTLVQPYFKERGKDEAYFGETIFRTLEEEYDIEDALRSHVS